MTDIVPKQDHRVRASGAAGVICEARRPRRGRRFTWGKRRHEAIEHVERYRGATPVRSSRAGPGPGRCATRGAVFNQCKICHSFEAGKNLVGPSLHGVIGRKAGSVPGYAYSPAMKNADVTWNDNTLSKYLTDPKAFIPRDKMPFLGIKDPSQLGDLLAYLHQATQ